jgi:hypothetical protein
MEAAALIALGNLAIDGYEAYRQQGLEQGEARAKAIADLQARFDAGDADLTAALAGKPVPTSGPSSTA